VAKSLQEARLEVSTRTAASIANMERDGLFNQDTDDDARLLCFCGFRPRGSNPIATSGRTL
jgi:hypothetical protein